MLRRFAKILLGITPEKNRGGKSFKKGGGGFRWIGATIHIWRAFSQKKGKVQKDGKMQNYSKKESLKRGAGEWKRGGFLSTPREREVEEGRMEGVRPILVSTYCLGQNGKEESNMRRKKVRRGFRLRAYTTGVK